MFNRDFYPTPQNVIENMLLGVDFQDRVVLEPSAGKGDIVDYLQLNGAKEVIACELNPDLQKIVGSKCRLIGDDFLNVRSDEISHVNVIVMNPPFSDEERHILHAWEIAPGGCIVVSLCNNSVIKHPRSTKQWEIRDLIRDNGRTENFWDCFSTAERETDVEIGCIWLYKPVSGGDEFADYFDLSKEEEYQENGIVRFNEIRDIVGRYVQAVSMFDEVAQASNKINSLTADIQRYGIRFGAYRTGEKIYNSDKAITRDEFKKELQKQCWNHIFRKFNMDKYITKGVRENINKFVETQIHVPFTMRNVYKMIEMIVGTHEDRMKKVLVEAFDLICSYSAENSTAGEKWKTNSDYMINRKFIVPWICEYDTRWPSNNVNIRYSSNRDDIEDINRALCLLTGTNFDTIQSLYSFSQNTSNLPEKDRKDYTPMLWGQWYEYSFFRIRGYKKGTMHFEFKDEKVWEKFNREVARAKGWRLPKQSADTKKDRKKGTGIEVA